MDKKSASYLALGVVLGILFSTAVFSLKLRPEDAKAAQGSEQEARVLKLAHVLDQAHPVHRAMEFMADDLKRRSGGRLSLEIFPNGQLGSETESIEQVQRGALAMVKTSAATLEGFIPKMALFGVPYLFRSDEHYWNVLNGSLGQELLAAGSSVGLRGTCYYDSGSRSFYTRDRPVLSPKDLKGMKIRAVRSRMAMDTIAALGAAPTPIPWGELYTGLQQGVIDGAENNAPSLQTSRHYEVTKHYSLNEHTRVPDIVVFSERIWTTLSDEERHWIDEAARASVSFQRKLWQEQTEQAMLVLKKAGVEIHRPEKQPFIDAVGPLYRKLSPELSALVGRVRAVP